MNNTLLNYAGMFAGHGRLFSWDSGFAEGEFSWLIKCSVWKREDSTLFTLEASTGMSLKENMLTSVIRQPRLLGVPCSCPSLCKLIHVTTWYVYTRLVQQLGRSLTGERIIAPPPEKEKGYDLDLCALRFRAIRGHQDSGTGNLGNHVLEAEECTLTVSLDIAMVSQSDQIEDIPSTSCLQKAKMRLQAWHKFLVEWTSWLLGDFQCFLDHIATKFVFRNMQWFVGFTKKILNYQLFYSVSKHFGAIGLPPFCNEMVA